MLIVLNEREVVWTCELSALIPACLIVKALCNPVLLFNRHILCLLAAVYCGPYMFLTAATATDTGVPFIVKQTQEMPCICHWSWLIIIIMYHKSHEIRPLQQFLTVNLTLKAVCRLITFSITVVSVPQSVRWWFIDVSTLHVAHLPIMSGQTQVSLPPRLRTQDLTEVWALRLQLCRNHGSFQSPPESPGPQRWPPSHQTRLLVSFLDVDLSCRLCRSVTRHVPHLQPPSLAGRMRVCLSGELTRMPLYLATDRGPRHTVTSPRSIAWG